MRSLLRNRVVLLFVCTALFVLPGVGVAQKPVGAPAHPGTAQPASSRAHQLAALKRIASEADGARGKDGGDAEDEDDPYARADAFYLPRTAGDHPITVAQAAQLRDKAAESVQAQQQLQAAPDAAAAVPVPFSSAWTPVGPDPIVQAARGDAGFIAVSGRIGALAMRSSPPYTMFLGAAQGGVWISSTLTTKWTPMTDKLASLAVGAIALAPSNENVVYIGTGEGALSGDSYFGIGVVKSTDGGTTFAKVSGTTFNQVSISKIVVDPSNPNHLYLTTLRGRAGTRRLTPPSPTPYGIYESTNGGTTWKALLTTTNERRGATDMVMDPQFNGTSNRTLLASFWGEGIVKSTDGGATWKQAMNGFPTDANFANDTLDEDGLPGGSTRFSLGISHPAGSAEATVYSGFTYVDRNGTKHPSTIWKSTDAGDTWIETNTDVVKDFCGAQCFYDNDIGVDPKNANIVYALGLFNYSIGSGGIFRSLDGGATWRDLGYGLHPDFHAIAIRKDKPENIVIGNDGGVWSSASRGGRLQATDPISAVTWLNLNGTVNQDDLTATGTGLQITQFTSVAQHPINNRLYGGAQDNGTSRKINTPGSSRWYDFASGDGGQVLVDPHDPSYVYGTYYGISPYRFSDGMSNFFTNQTITTGITTTDRAEFYIPFKMDPEYTNRLYVGTFRMYRTDNHGDQWQAISPDLTSGCPGYAPNGGRGCYISAIGVTAGAPAVYAGTEEGWISLSTNTDSANPTWTRVDKSPLPARPVASIAVDRSNYLEAYAAFNGFNAATPTYPGHVFKTTNGGQTWTNISGNLPDIPVNSLVLDPSKADTIYAGTDVGPMMTTNGGTSWQPLGAGFPNVAVDQLDLNSFTRRLAAASYGRGAWTSTDAVTTTAALQVRALDAGVPVGPGSLLTYTITLKNSGNAAANGVAISQPLPDNTELVSSSAGGTTAGSTVSWKNLTVPAATPGAPTAGGSPLVEGVISVTLTVRIGMSAATGESIVLDGATVTASKLPTINGSPFMVPIAPANALTLTPASQLDGTRAGQSITYTLSLKNLGYSTDTFNLAVGSNAWPTQIYSSDFTAPISQTPTLMAGASTTFGVKVSIPASATNNITDTAAITATSSLSPTVSASATITTIAVTKTILLVDEDGSSAASDAPDVRPFYEAALQRAGADYNVWDLAANPVLPPNYLKAHAAAIWFTGTSYPGPLLPYEGELANYLNNGGNFFLSGWDILDQAAGTTPFVKNYLHVDWDGSEKQNDIGTTQVTAVPTNTVTGDLGTLPFDPKVLLPEGDYSDEITPIAPAVPAFLDDNNQPDALTVADQSYKVVFLAIPFEGLGTLTDRATLMQHVLAFFGTTGQPTTPTPTPGPIPNPVGVPKIYLPLIGQ